MPRYLGLDLNKQYIHSCESRSDAPADHKERHFRFSNTLHGWSTLIDRLDQACWVAFEVTGSAFEVHDRLSSHAGKVLLANPLALKRLGSGRHTNRVDAARLGKMLALETPPHRLGPAAADAGRPPAPTLSRAARAHPASSYQPGEGRAPTA